MGQYPSLNRRQLERRLREIGCELLRTAGSHRHYSNPFHPDRLVTFAWHAGDVPRGIVADNAVFIGLVPACFVRARQEDMRPARFTLVEPPTPASSRNRPDGEPIRDSARGILKIQRDQGGPFYGLTPTPIVVSCAASGNCVMAGNPIPALPVVAIFARLRG